MATPKQTLETKKRHDGSYKWEGSSSKKGPYSWKKSKVNSFDNLLDAQVDELVEKGEVGQQVLADFMRKLTTKFPGAHTSFREKGKVSQGYKAQQTIHDKIVERKKGNAAAINDCSRGTVFFKTLDGLYGADLWLQSQDEYLVLAKDPQHMGTDIRKNHYRSKSVLEDEGVDDPEGQYKDIKFFLALDINGKTAPKTGLPISTKKRWIVELQLNIQTSQQGKTIGHGIYEVTRIGGKGDIKFPYQVTNNKLKRIASKLRTTYLLIYNGKIQIDANDLSAFKTFVERFQINDVAKDKSSKTSLGNGLISKTDHEMLGRVSAAIYRHSLKHSKHAQLMVDGKLQHAMNTDLKSNLSSDKTEKWTDKDGKRRWTPVV